MSGACSHAPYRRRPALLLLLCVLLAVPAFSVGADDPAAKAAELAALRERMQTLQNRLRHNQDKKSRAEQKLREVETKISTASRELLRIEHRLENSTRQLADLQTRQQEQTRALRQQRRQIAREARASYAMGRQQQVKLLLNQEQPAAVGRALTYFGYLSRARMARVDSIHTALAELQATTASIQDTNRELMELRSRQLLASRRLQEKKQQREQVVAKIGRELESQSDELHRLRQDEKRLQKLLASLRELLADIPLDASHHQPFRTLKGKLHWPAPGRLTSRFGSRRGNSGLTWQGVTITAPEGTRVRAIAQGRVAFADWMRGFGLLLIVDHGDGYMSLYGHNQALYKEVGEWVDTGEMVATLGASGGQNRPGLYFELRHQGRPINPVRWCSGRPASLS
ncbi:MAG TPA: peptidase M23 [Gammaproteobacteria bacterium]|nr:peptidase M23 [Gammaproteobacteria bacterium]